MSLRILFISRAYPPIVGGIENHNHALSIWLGKRASVTTIANRFGKLFLPIFLPYALIRTLVCARRFDAILLGDGVLSIVGWAVKCFYAKKAVISVVHGLDITYPFFLYQALWVRVFLPKLDRLIAVGNETIRVGEEHGIPKDRFLFIPNGVDTSAHFHPEYTRKDLEGVIGDSLSGKRVLLTSGRLARRKGVAWFIRNVLPILPETTLYVVAGDGADRENIQSAIEETKLFTRVKPLGYVSDRARDILMNTCDLFVQPNIRIPNDIEGFGISVIEAASCGIPVIVSRLEGLKDAIADGKNGILVEPENAASWKEAIERFLNDDVARKTFGTQARDYISRHFDWGTISACYLGAIQETVTATTGERELKRKKH